MRNSVRRWTALISAVLFALPSAPMTIKANTPQILEGDYIVITNTNSKIFGDAESTGALVVDAGGAAANESNRSVYETNDNFIEKEIPESRINYANRSARVKTYQIGEVRGQYEVLAVSEHSVIWMDKDLKAKYGDNAILAAEEMIQVYEGRPYEILNEISNHDFPYQDGSGKLSIMLEVTSNGSSGYFSQDPDITAIHINAPETYKKGYFNGTSGLLTHEGQHAVFFWKVLSGNSDSTLRWFNEGLSVAIMDYTWGGNDPTGWLEKISGNNTIRKGSALTYSTYRNTTVQDYSMPYLFVRYLISQKAEDYQPIEFIKSVYNVKFNGDTAQFIEAVLANAGLKTKLPTFSDALKNFYIAAFKQSESGLDGFYGDPIVKKQVSNYPVAYLNTNTEIMLEPTASLVVKTIDGKFTVPSDHGEHITYTPVTLDSSISLSGQGTETDPYLIKTPADLRYLSVAPSAFFRLEQDLDYSGKNWMSVADFSGVLDGANHTIFSLNQPLISQNTGTIENLNVTVDINVDSSNYVGGLVCANQGIITDCSIGGTMRVNMLESSMSFLTQAIGGMSGYNEMPGIISRSYSTVALTGQLSASLSAIGNFVGYNTGIIEDSYSAGSLTVSRSTSAITSAYAGGFLGQSGSSTSFTQFGFRVQNCHSVTPLNITDSSNILKVGTFEGYANSTNQSSVYALSQADYPAVAVHTGEDNRKAQNKSAEEMKTEATFVSWDFGTVWTMGNAYPELGKAELILGEILGLAECYVGEDYNSRLKFSAQLQVNSGTVSITKNMLEGFNPEKEGPLTFTVNYRGQRKTHTIQVRKPTISEIEISNKPTKLNYQEGDHFNPEGIKLYAKTSDNVNLYIISGFTWEPEGPLDTSVKEIKIHYFDSTLTQTINVSEKIVDRIEIINEPEKMVYRPGEAFDPTGMQLRITYTNNNQTEIFGSNQFEKYGIGFAIENDGELVVIDTNELSPEINGMTLYATSGDVGVKIGLVYVIEPLNFKDQTIEVAAGVDYGDSDLNNGQAQMIQPIQVGEVTGGSGKYNYSPAYVVVDGTLALGFAGDILELRGKAENLGTYTKKIKVVDETTSEEVIATITVKVTNNKNSDADFETFEIPYDSTNANLVNGGIVGIVDSVNKTVTLNLPKAQDGSQYADKLIPAFKLTRGTLINVWNQVLMLEKDAYVLTSEDGTTVNKYTVIVNYEDDSLLRNAELKTLSIEGVDLGSFDSSIVQYSADVENNVTDLKVTATAQAEGATVTITGNQDLKVGKNEVVVKVVAKDGFTNKYYRITINRKAAPQKSTDASLKSLGISEGTLSPVFSKDTMSYTATVDNSVSQLTVSAESTDTKATVTGTGVQNLIVGTNTIEIGVTAEDGTTKKTYTIVVTRQAAKSTDATLKSLSINEGTLSPEFSKDTMSYTATVENSVSQLTISAEPTDTRATVTGSGVHNLTVGTNTIEVGVTAEDGTTKKTYTIVVTRQAPKSTDATLKSLSISEGTLSPEFSKDTMSYTATVDNRVSQLTVSAESTDTKATVTGSRVHNLTVGTNTIEVGVTAEDGTTKKTYTIVVTRQEAKSSDATLKSLNISEGTLFPEFSKDTMSYTATVDNSVSQLTVSAESTDTKATVTGSGVKNLADGTNTIEIGVTAEDGTTKKTYTIVVTRQAPKSTDATLKSLNISEGTLSPEFSQDTMSYTATVDNSVSQLTVSAESTDTKATVTGSGVKNLIVGTNTIEVGVTAEDGTTKKTYTIVITRQEAKSTDATLKSLSLNEGTLSPVFSKDTMSYTATVDNSVSQLTVSAEPTDTKATVTGTGIQNLTVGTNTIEIGVTAEDGTTKKTYTIVITRQEAKSSDATLKSLILSNGTLTPIFSPDTENYSVIVANSVKEITVNVATNHAKATAEVIGSTSLAEGENKISIQVTAEDGTVKTYTITITREALKSSDASLEELTLSAGSLDPQFNPEIFAYSVVVENEITSLQVHAVAKHANATVMATGFSDLQVGENQITVTVTAEDGTKKETIITVIRKEPIRSSNANLKAIQGIVLNETFDPEVLEYTAKAVNPSMIQILGITQDDQASVNAQASSLDDEGVLWTIHVTAADGSVKEYFVTITKEELELSHDALLLSLEGLNVDPEFNSYVYSYNAEVEADITSLTLNVTVSDHASVQISGHENLHEGQNKIVITVVAEDNSTSMTYTINVTRKSAAKPNADTQLLLEKLISTDKVNEGSMHDFVQLHQALNALPEDQKVFFTQEYQEKLNALKSVAEKVNHQPTGASVENIPWHIALEVEELSKEVAKGYVQSVLGKQEVLFGLQIQFVDRVNNDTLWNSGSSITIAVEKVIDLETFTEIKVYHIANGVPTERQITMEGGITKITSPDFSPFVVTGTRREQQKPHEEESKTENEVIPTPTASIPAKAKPKPTSEPSRLPQTTPETTPETNMKSEPTSLPTETPKASSVPEATIQPQKSTNQSSSWILWVTVLGIAVIGGGFFIFKKLK
ncbi:cadherin-like beta sandwich domain-containing protein [Holdemania massiliensis]|uniref:cadherin-like beta sandwich domain-containing protein n=1 Tax=Holdemania massiliensis TaxID=1468449 RepID=UPI001F0574C4|nr:cadherin-like beta sandwich domain-containing protein [Holdemania massiliensis]MCH1942800.1 cadherin-like beta sandwich domain-containing protein [Holdemania massiliensis]